MKVNVFGIAGILIAGFCSSVLALESLKGAPEGTRIRMTKGGGFQIRCVASAIYDSNELDELDTARKKATIRAKAGIAKFLEEDLATKQSMAEKEEMFESVDSDGNVEKKNFNSKEMSAMMEEIHSSARALLVGVVLLGDEKLPAGNGEGGVYRVMMGVSSKTLEVAGKANASIAASGSGTAANGLPGLVGDAPESGVAAPEGCPPVPKGWIVCLGQGKDRYQAIHAALVEGVSQVFGTELQSNSRLASRSKKMKQSLGMGDSKESTSSKMSEEQMSSETVTATAGFVREYRIIKISPKDGGKQAVIYALIFNPKSGGAMALVVRQPKMTIQDRTEVYKVGPKKRMSGAEVAEAVKFALPSAMRKVNKFLIIDENTQAQSEEFVLTPDYILESEISDVKWSKKLGMDKKTNKFATLYKMSMKLTVRLLDAKSGNEVNADIITLKLENQEISDLLEDDEDTDFLQAILMKLGEPIEEWLGKKKTE